MMSSAASRAADTAALLVEQPASGARPMIPGSFEVRVRQPSGARATGVPRVAEPVHPGAANGRERLEREREGGGATSQRRRRSGTLVARLWRSLRHPTALPQIWYDVQSERV